MTDAEVGFLFQTAKFLATSVTFHDPEHLKRKYLFDAVMAEFDTDSNGLAFFRGLVANAPQTQTALSDTVLPEKAEIGSSNGPSETNVRMLYNLTEYISWSYIESLFAKVDYLGNPIEPPLLELATFHAGLVFNGARSAKAALIMRRDLTPRLHTSGELAKIQEAATATLRKDMAESEQKVQAHMAMLLGEADSHIGVLTVAVAKEQATIDGSEAKINAYIKSLEEYQVAFGWVALTKAFESFFKRKEAERNTLRCWVLGSIAGIVFLPIASLLIGPWIIELIQWGLPKNSGELALWIKYATVTFAELLLLYFFRIALGMYNSVQAQLLQLEMRMAVTGFLQEYKKVVESTDGVKMDYSRFESLLFGGITTDPNNVPTAFDGLTQIVDAFEKVKKASK